MSKTYSAGIVTAYGAAKRAGYTGTYEDFCRQQAGYAESAAVVEDAKDAAVSAASIATAKAGEASTAATAAQTAKTQTEAAASQALSAISSASSSAISAVQTEGATQTANATAQAQAAATSATTASTKASEASASATTATTKATEAAASATSAANAASAAQGVLESIPEDYSDLSEGVEQLKDDLADVNKSLYEDGDLVYIQKVSADSMVLNSPSGMIHVVSTDGKIYTGSKNFVDLLEFAQGTFTDSNSGVTISVSGTEMHIYGSPTKGFRYNPQTGEFYTDAFANHPADFSNLTNEVVGYRLCFWEQDGYTMPSNIYFATLKDDESGISAAGLNGHSKYIKSKSGNYIALYSNGAISNLDDKFTFGLKFDKASASIESVAKAQANTNVIVKPGYYECEENTWTGTSTEYRAYSTTFLLQKDPLTNNHVYAWFGDSLSQLRELPNLVSELLGVTVYDCTFAGAPLTYGDPTKYQPTGFMSLCSQIVSEDFTPLSNALDAQQSAGINVTEKRVHLATLQSLDFGTVTDIVLFAGTNDFDNDYVNATNFVSGFTSALTTLLTAYPHLMVYVFSPTWRGDKSEGVQTIPTMPDLIQLEKGVADNFSLPFYDLYHRSGINALTASIYLESDKLHPSSQGDLLLANKCAKFIQSN